MTPAARTVVASGPRDARIAIVGEAPGEAEERLGEPFAGASGRLLTEMLAGAGIARRGCYVTNVVRERPPGNDFWDRYYADKHGTVPTEALVEAQVRVRAEIVAVAPNVTIALGEEALRALTGRHGIMKWRGSVLDTSLGKVVPTVEPETVQKKYELRALVEMDLRRAAREGASRESPALGLVLVVDPTGEQVLEWLGRVRGGSTPVAFDIETLGATVRCIALARDEHEALCIPFVSCRAPRASTPATTLLTMPSDTAFSSHWDAATELNILRELARVLEDPAIPLIAQNFPFDAAMLTREFGIVPTGLWMDTMVAQHCCYCELPKSLAFLCSVYTRIPFYKDHDASSDLDEWRYNATDAVATWQVAQALAKEMKELGV